MNSQKMWFELYTKYTKKLHGNQFAHYKCMAIPLCVTELLQLLSPNRNERYTGFQYINEKMIDQLNV